MMIFMINISPEELVKALNNIAVLYQDEDSAPNGYTLIYRAEVQEKFGEKVIVVKSF